MKWTIRVVPAMRRNCANVIPILWNIADLQRFSRLDLMICLPQGYTAHGCRFRCGLVSQDERQGVSPSGTIPDLKFDQNSDENTRRANALPLAGISSHRVTNTP